MACRRYLARREASLARLCGTARGEASCLASVAVGGKILHKQLNIHTTILQSTSNDYCTYSACSFRKWIYQIYQKMDMDISYLNMHPMCSLSNKSQCQNIYLSIGEKYRHLCIHSHLFFFDLVLTDDTTLFKDFSVSSHQTLLSI